MLRTKADAMLERWGDRYCLIGPYNPATAAVEFEEQPTEGIIRETLDRLRDAGHPVPLRPLADPRPAARDPARLPRALPRSSTHDKYLMWKDHGISTHANDGEVNEVVAFGFTVDGVLPRADRGRRRTAPILAHFHEWMGGVAVPRIAHLQLPVTTIFTTHATLLGRYLASDNPHFYDHLPFINPDEEAAQVQHLAAASRSSGPRRTRRPCSRPSAK